MTKSTKEIWYLLRIFVKDPNIKGYTLVEEEVITDITVRQAINKAEEYVALFKKEHSEVEYQLKKAEWVIIKGVAEAVPRKNDKK